MPLRAQTQALLCAVLLSAQRPQTACGRQTSGGGGRSGRGHERRRGSGREWTSDTAQVVARVVDTTFVDGSRYAGTHRLAFEPIERLRTRACALRSLRLRRSAACDG
jgi:hypothetical protein